MISEYWGRIMKDPIKVLEALNKDFGSLLMREKILPSEDAATLNVLEKEKKNIVELNKKLSRTEYHNVYSQHIMKDSISDIESKLKRYDVSIDDEEKKLIMMIKERKVPKLKAVLSDIKEIKKGVKKRYKSDDFVKLKSIVKAGADNVFQRKHNNRKLIDLEKIRLNTIKKMHHLTMSLEMKVKDGSKESEVLRVLEEHNKNHAKIKEINAKIKALEDDIARLEKESKVIVKEFVTLSEEIKSSTQKENKEMMQIEKRGYID